MSLAPPPRQPAPVRASRRNPPRPETVLAVGALLLAGASLTELLPLSAVAALSLVVAAPLLVRVARAAADRHGLARREARFRALVCAGHDLVVLLDDALRVRWQSPAATRLFGLTDHDVLGHRFVDLLHPADAHAAEAALAAVRLGRPPGLLTARLRDSHGHWRETESTISDLRDVPEVAAVVLHVRDISQRTRPEPVAPHPARTGSTPSRPASGPASRHELRRALAGRTTTVRDASALLVLALHDLGTDRTTTDADQLRDQIIRRLHATTGPDDLVAHLGGAEFAVLTEGSTLPAYGLAARLLTVLTEPYPLPGGPVRPTVSIGLADTLGGSADDTLRQADLARRRARQLGRNRIEWYDAFVGDQLVRRLDLERELTGALARGELDLVYQPVHGLADRTPVGTEALLRWRNSLLGTVPPAELIPVATDLGLLDEVGQWVLDRACRQLAAWSTANPLLWMAVNVSPPELAGPDYVARVADTLARHRIPAGRLVVEVDESTVDVDLPTVVGRLAALRSLGVRTALDDFHAGRASLRRLRELPIDLVKVDPRAVGDGEPDQPLIDVVTTLGRRLGWEVVVEELESAGQVDRAHRAGCRYGQGYALSHPAPAERVEAYLTAPRPLTDRR